MSNRARGSHWSRLAQLGPLAVLLLAGCAVGPNYQRPAVAVPPGFKSAQAPEQAPPVITAEWVALFQDPKLVELLHQALAANLDIRAAIARVDEAQAALQQARAAFLPAVDLDPSVRRSGNALGTSTLFSLPLALSYEVDVWGRLRRQYEYYQATRAASADDLALVQQTIAATVSQAYFNLQYYDREIRVLREALNLFRKQVDLTTMKFKAGLTLPTDLLQARNQVDTATNQLIEVRRARAKQEHAIALLLGQPPAAFGLDEITTVATVPAIPAGLPADLLNRRPDVAEAERRLVAANAGIGVAIAEFFPTFSIGGSAGFQSSSSANLLKWESRIWSLTPSANLPLFRGGAQVAAVEQNRARFRELLANYRTAVLGAFRDVEDELSDLHLLAEESASLEQTVANAREYARLTELQYQQGLTDYLQVIIANQTLLNNELQAAAAQNNRLAASVLLIKALGGGWSDPDAPR